LITKLLVVSIIKLYDDIWSPFVTCNGASYEDVAVEDEGTAEMRLITSSNAAACMSPRYKSINIFSIQDVC
jgi:hypothetical protein